MQDTARESYFEHPDVRPQDVEAFHRFREKKAREARKN